MKKFYTDKDIEELFHSGVKSLQVTDDVVLTDLAYEKAGAWVFNLYRLRGSSSRCAGPTLSFGEESASFKAES